MRWPFGRDRKPPRLYRDTVKEIVSLSDELDNDALINCVVAMVSDRRFTAEQRSRLFLRLGGRVVATTPRPDRDH